MLERIKLEAQNFLDTSRLNYIPLNNTYSDDYAGKRIWKEALICVGDANDEMFKWLREPGVLHPEAYMPQDFVPDAKSVISFFLPFTDEIKADNAKNLNNASELWMLGSSLGQTALIGLSETIAELLRNNGYDAAVPQTDPRAKSLAKSVSCWSERHIAHICGLGTFGMSRGLITEKGIAGRFGSVVTNAVLPVTERKYTGHFDYCIKCGACANNCPGDAINMQRGFYEGKDNAACTETLKKICGPYQREDRPHYHCCGKCQVNTPCADGIPKRA